MGGSCWVGAAEEVRGCGVWEEVDGSRYIFLDMVVTNTVACFVCVHRSAMAMAMAMNNPVAVAV